MEPTFVDAIGHIKIMQDRILHQTEAIGLLKVMGQDTADADRRLRLLNFAMTEMRLQLAQLAPSDEQVAAPTWALPLVSTAPQS